MDEIIEMLRALGLEPTPENIRRATQAVNDQYFNRGRVDPVARDREAQAGVRRRRAAEVRARPGRLLNAAGEQSLGRLLTALAPAPGTETEAERRVLGPIADVVPVVGDIKGAVEGYNLAREGHPFLGAGVALAGALPFLPFSLKALLGGEVSQAGARGFAGRLKPSVRVGDKVYTSDVMHIDAIREAAEAEGMDVPSLIRLAEEGGDVDLDLFTDVQSGQSLSRDQAEQLLNARTSEEMFAMRGANPERFADQNRAISEATAANQGATFTTEGEDLIGSDNFVTAIRPGDDMVVPAASGGGVQQAYLNQFRERFAEDLAVPEHNIGTWRRAATEKEIEQGLAGADGEVVVLDVAKTFERSEEGYQQALELAQTNEQDAIFDLNAVEEIRLRDSETKEPVEVPSYADYRARVDQPSQTPTLDAMSDEERLAGLERIRNMPDRRQGQQAFEGPDRRSGSERRTEVNPEIAEAEEALRRFVTGGIEERRAAGGDLGARLGGDPLAGEASVRERLLGQIESQRAPQRVTPDELNFEPPQRLFHGTAATFDQFDPSRGEFGGTFLTPDPAVASDYAQARARQGNPQVRPVYLEGDIYDVPEGAPIPGPESGYGAVRLHDGQIIAYDTERVVPAFERETGPPKDLMAPLTGAPFVRPASAYSDRTYGIFDPDAPPIEGTRNVDELYRAREAPRARTNSFFEALANSSAVRRAFDADVIRGLDLLEGRPWYETGGLLQVAGDEGTFRNWNALGAAASMQNSVPSEMALASLLNFAGRRGIWDMDEALDLYRSHFGMNPDEPLNFLRSGDHFTKGRQAMESGLLLPVSGGEIHYNAGTWKTPSYFQARQGAGDAMSTIDTHERRRLWQIAMANPRLRRLAKSEFTPTQLRTAQGEGLVPIRNLPDYQTLSSIYERGAQRLGFPTASSYQAPRWTGGGRLTGLESNPTRTYQELLADQVLGTAAAQGMDESPAGLRRLLGDVLQGNQLLLPGPFRF